MALAALDHLLERVEERAELLLAVDERRVEAARPSRRVRPYLEDGVCVERLASLDSAMRERLHDHRIADEPMRRFADQDLVRRGGLLEALRNGHGGAGHDQMALEVVAGHHLAAVDPDASLKAHAPGRLEPRIEPGQGFAH